MKIPCNIVQDLLPNYIDELCSEETRKQVGEHLGDCQMCDRKYREMKGGLPEEEKKELEDNLLEEIQPMKKIKKRHIWQLASLAVLIVITVIGAGVSIAKGSSEGFQKGYNEGTEQGYSTGYTAGVDEGYDTGYTKGYVDGTAENPNLLTMKVETQSVGELFSNLWTLMQKKWGLDETLRIVMEEDYAGFAIPDMNGQHLCLSDGKAVYIVESFVGYIENTLTIEVKCVEPDAIKIAEESVRFAAFVDCMEVLNLQMDADYGETLYTFLFNANEDLKTAPRIAVLVEDVGEYSQKEWIYQNGKAEQCLEDTTLEGQGRYFLLSVIGVGYAEKDNQTLGVLESHQVYIEMQ